MSKKTDKKAALEAKRAAALKAAEKARAEGDEAAAVAAEKEAQEDADEEAQEDDEDAKVAVLDSPAAFGIYIDYGRGPILKRFMKGKTPLNAVEEAACKDHPYVKDNGAEVLYK